MKLHYVSIFAWLLLSASIGSAQAPSTAPSEPMMLDGGKLLFTAPRELTLLGKRDDDLSASYSLGENRALVTLVVTRQPQAIPDDFPPKLARLLTKTIREEASRGAIDIVMQPRGQTTPGMLLNLHDKFNTEERFGDRAQMYRGVGLYLVGVIATAFTEDEAEAKRVHELGAELLMSVRINRGGAKKSGPVTRGAATRPVTFAEAKIRVTPPGGWNAQTTENASGMIVTYRDPQDQSNLIMISVRQLPPEARRDPELRDIIIDELVAGEKQSFKIDGAELHGDSKTITDRRFLRKTRTDYAHQERRFSVTSRQLRVGDALVSVTMVAREQSVDAVDALADKVALDVRPLR